MKELGHSDLLDQVCYCCKKISHMMEIVNLHSFSFLFPNMQMPENNALQSLVGGMLMAWKIYNRA